MKKKNTAPAAKPRTVDNPGEVPAHVEAAAEHTGAAARRRIEGAIEREGEAEDATILDVIKSELGTGAYVRLHRKKITDSQFALIEPRIPLDNFSADWVLQTFGGGDYRAEFRRSDNTFVRNLIFTIDHSIPSKHPREAAQAAAPKEDTAAIINALRDAMPKQESGGMMPLMIAMLDSQAKQSAAMFTALASMGKGSGGDSEITKILLEKALTRERQTPTAELIENMRALDKMRKGDFSETPDPEDQEPPSLLEKILGKDWTEKLVPMIVEQVASRMGAGPAQPPPPRRVSPIAVGETAAATTSTAASVATAPQPAAAKTQPTATAENDPAMFLKMFGSTIRTTAIQAAQEKKDPYEFVQGLAAIIPARYLPTVFNLVNADDWFLQIFGADQESGKHQKFLSDVRNAILYLALVSVAAEHHSKQATPAATAAAFLSWASESFKMDLEEAVGDPSWFASNFPPEFYDANKSWVEQLRVDLAAKLTAAAVPPARGANGTGKGGVPKANAPGGR